MLESTRVEPMACTVYDLLKPLSALGTTTNLKLEPPAERVPPLIL